MRTLAMPKAAEPSSLTSLREKLIKIGEGRQPRSLRHLPIGRGLGVAADVWRNLAGDRAPGGATRASTSGAGVGSDRRRRERVRLDTGERSISAPRCSRRAGWAPAVHA